MRNWRGGQGNSQYKVAGKDGIIIFTDLCCDDYGDPARTSILWASTDEIWTGNEGWYSNKPPFGEVVQVDLERR
tara:strand:- start:2063 stop:2284 length:222 start_codon:yes stop_codon:yes gene_type:complete